MASLSVFRQPMRLRIISSTCLNCRNFCFTGQRFSAKKGPEPEPEIFDPAWAPVKYSTSKAASHNARDEVYLQGREKNRYKYEPEIVNLSFWIFMIYFCILREENDIDEELGKDLYVRFPELEISHLKMKRELTPEQAERLKFLQKTIYNK